MTDALSEIPSPPSAPPAPRIGTTPAASVIAECLRIQYTVADRSKAARLFGRSPLSVDSRSWYLGALGELDVANRMSALGPEWTVLHALPIGTRGSDIDHVAVGPGGVFTINTKFHERANVWVASRRMLINGQKTEHLRNARYEASRVSRLLTQESGMPVPVVGVIALVAIGRLTFKTRPEDVVVLRELELVRWMQKRPAILTRNDLARLIPLVSDANTWGTETQSADTAAFARLRASVERAKRVRIAWALTAFIAFPLAAMTPLVWLPQLLSP